MINNFIITSWTELPDAGVLVDAGGQWTSASDVALRQAGVKREVNLPSSAHPCCHLELCTPHCRALVYCFGWLLTARPPSTGIISFLVRY